MILKIPNTGHLSRMYYELAKIGAVCAGARLNWPYKVYEKEELVALACDMSRYDPRLFDILVNYLVKHWEDLNPFLLRKYYGRMKTPQTIAVVGEFFIREVVGGEALYFAEYLAMGQKPVPTQFFFYGLYAPGGYLARRAAEESVWEYKKWGFLACERPVVDSASRREAGLLDTTSRCNILKRLLHEKKEISLADYLDVVSHCVSRQQAFFDLKKSGLACRTGRGRGAKWKIATHT